MKAEHFKTFTVQPICKMLRAYSLSAEALMLGTPATESAMGKYLRQRYYTLESNGGAFGPNQIELNAHDGVIIWLEKHSLISSKVSHMLRVVKQLRFGPDTIEFTKLNLINNLAYSTAIARCMYYSITKPLPAADDLMGLGHYWNDYYNRNDEHGTPEEFVAAYRRYVK